MEVYDPVKRLISILLVAAMIVSIVAVTGFAEEHKTPDDVFEAIDAALLASSSFRAPLTDAKKTQIAKTAVEKLGYQTEDRGNCCFVFDVGDEPCIFNCRMYNILSEMKPLEGYVDDGEVVTVDYGTRSTGPDNGAKDVVLIEPFYGTDSSFTRQYQTEASSIAKATGGTYTLYKTSAATIDAVADGIENAAVVIFDSHGDTDYMASYYSEDYVSEANTSYLLLVTGTGLTSADKSRATGEFSTYNHAYSSGGYYYVDGTAITNHMEKSAPNNLVWMAICLGMATDGLEKPFRDHGVGVVYGYSQSVTFDGDYDYEETFWSNMKNGKDVKTAISAMKSKHGDWDPGSGCSSISTARRNYAAFPIVVSDLDVYPGHGNVDALQTVNSDWELFGSAVSYKVTAVSENTRYGTVSLSGNTVTATPAEGYYASGYSVSPNGACNVKQDGNLFTISNITADCTVTIKFAEKQRAEISYVVPDGVTCPKTEGYEGDTVKLPTPQGTPTADRYAYRFIGWTDAPLTDSLTKPNVYAAGSELKLSGNRTFYALYTYFSTSGDGAFTQLRSEQDDYSGDYVISYDGSAFLDASGDLIGTAIGGKKAVVPMTDTGMVLVDDKLYEVPDTLVYQVELYDANEKTYTVKMKGTEAYLYHTLTVNSLATTTKASNAGAQWKFIISDGAVKLKNASTGKYLQYNPTSAVFRCYSDGAQKDLTLYSAGSGSVYYTTELKNSCAHSWDEGSVSVEQTCTQSGIVLYTCLLCGQTRVEVLPALGHDYVDGICSRCGDEDPNWEPPVPVDPCEGYVDIDRNAWYHAAAVFVIEKGHMGSTKTDALTFEPNTKVSRAMVASILYRIAGNEEEADYQGTFSDVPDGKWYTTAIEWCAKNGLASGMGDGTFDPNGNVTRQELAVFMFNLAKFLGRDVSGRADLSSFADNTSVPAWSKEYLAWAVDAGIISGQASNGKTYLKPTAGAMRNELASILMRFWAND